MITFSFCDASIAWKETFSVTSIRLTLNYVRLNNARWQAFMDMILRHGVAVNWHKIRVKCTIYGGSNSKVISPLPLAKEAH
jgi:hypothetical protein